MCGSGTTLVEARILGRHATGVDINLDAVALSSRRLADTPSTDQCCQVVGQGDARNLPHANDSVDLVTLHPPYWNIIRYSDSVEGDLSGMSYQEFFVALAQVAAEAFRLLRPNGHCAVLMGDTRQRKHLVPLSFHTLNLFLEAGFVIREHVIKVQHNTTSARNWPGTYDFLLLAHENLFILRKPKTDERPFPLSCRGTKDP